MVNECINNIYAGCLLVISVGFKVFIKGIESKKKY